LSPVIVTPSSLPTIVIVSVLGLVSPSPSRSV